MTNQSPNGSLPSFFSRMILIVASRAAYIHVPFCAHRCGYCDFTLIAGRDDLIGDYLRALDRELQSVPSDTQPVTSLFFGGGTPTHPPLDELRTLFQIVDAHLPRASGAEVSVEANPLDLSEDKIAVLTEAGVNRISLGIQSFSPDALRLLERDHLPNDIESVVQRLKPRFQNLAFDLIFGVPGQSLADWRETLRRAIELGPQHISTYGLTWEAGTAFGTRRDRGELSPIDEELERDQYAVAMEELPAAGFEQYEISNFARPGFACRHNEVYWAGDEYWAFGPGAARYQNGRRETNIRSVLGWLARMERGESPVADAEELEPVHRAHELIYLGLRRLRGIRRDVFHQRTGQTLDDLVGTAIADNVRRGWLIDDGDSIRLSRDGRFVADRVVTDFL